MRATRTQKNYNFTKIIIKIFPSRASFGATVKFKYCMETFCTARAFIKWLFISCHADEADGWEAATIKFSSLVRAHSLSVLLNHHKLFRLSRNIIQFYPKARHPLTHSLKIKIKDCCDDKRERERERKRVLTELSAEGVDSLINYVKKIKIEWAARTKGEEEEEPK